VISVIASIIIIGSIAIIPALAAQGTATWINHPEKHGKITEDGTGDVFNFQIPKGAAPGYEEEFVDLKMLQIQKEGKSVLTLTNHRHRHHHRHHHHHHHYS